MSSLTKFVIALIGLVAMTIFVSRQLFLFAAFRNLGFVDSQAARSHLWIAMCAGIAASISAILMFYFFTRYEKEKWSKVLMSPPGPLLPFLASDPANSPAPARYNAERWALANPWLVKQPDDRIPMDGSVRDIGVTPSEQRSFARRTHQLMFKKWSQERHY